MENRPHIPVLLKEVVAALAVQANDNVVDCTVGAGGHSAAMLELTAPNGKLLGLDLDEAALDSARKTLERFGSRAMLVRENYANVRRVLLSQSFGPVQAALLDLGFSSIEIDDPSRGFSFRFDGPLDMRFDDRQDVTAVSIVNSWSPDELAELLTEYGEERFARNIAKGIVDRRREKRLLTTLDLVETIESSVPGFYRRGKIHPATKTFQALRIAVNDELGTIREALPELLAALEPGGRLAVISFHSLEDRIVKHFFRDEAKKETLEVLTKRPIEAGEEEVAANPRSRSAKMRVVRKK